MANIDGYEKQKLSSLQTTSKMIKEDVDAVLILGKNLSKYLIT